MTVISEKRINRKEGISLPLESIDEKYPELIER